MIFYLLVWRFMDQNKIFGILVWVFFTSPCCNNTPGFLISEELICILADLHACHRHLILWIWSVDGGSFCHIPCHPRVLNLGKAEQEAVNSLIAVSMHPVNP